MITEMYSYCILLVVSVLSVCSGVEDQWKVQEFPNPIYQVEDCGRSADVEKSWICDPNKVISEQDVNDISDKLVEIHTNSRCNCEMCIRNKTGYVVMVAIMPRMHRIINASDSMADIMQDARVYSYYLSLYWGSFATCNELVLLLISRDDGVVYTLTQSDARKKLTDELVTKITLDNQKYFDGKDRVKIGQGIKSMINKYGILLRGQSIE
ncbi:uncharacterized protein LOC127724373 [Mytilus californianus]|uniref:uncharacterized protein LOC127724373 n=1 Tax=Mytilus californianus TaxID=6549 RepID=UPI0022453C63|nr:uncharacterized protein LOC127724373 [Mytilus californianus]